MPKVASSPAKPQSRADVPGIRIQPLNDRLVIEYEESAKMTESGRLHLPDKRQEPNSSAGVDARVIAVGPGRFSEKLWARIPIAVKPGDRIKVPRQNLPIKVDGREVFFIFEWQVLGVAE